MTPARHGHYSRSGDLLSIKSASQLPDYLNDLNAIHEAESFMDREEDEFCERWLFGAVLMNVVLNRRVMSVEAGWYYASRATAAQRCEALLRTIWKWEEA